MRSNDQCEAADRYPHYCLVGRRALKPLVFAISFNGHSSQCVSAVETESAVKAVFHAIVHGSEMAAGAGEGMLHACKTRRNSN